MAKRTLILLLLATLILAACGEDGGEDFIAPEQPQFVLVNAQTNATGQNNNVCWPAGVGNIRCEVSFPTDGDLQNITAMVGDEITLNQTSGLAPNSLRVRVLDGANNVVQEQQLNSVAPFTIENVPDGRYRIEVVAYYTDLEETDALVSSVFGLDLSVAVATDNGTQNGTASETPTTAPSEVPTEVMTEAPTEVMTEAPTETPTATATDVPPTVTPTATEEASEVATEASTEAATELATETITDEAPTEAVTVSVAEDVATDTATATQAASATPEPTTEVEPTATQMASATATEAEVATETVPPTATNTQTPSATATLIPTDTSVPPTNTPTLTATLVPPTDTPVPTATTPPPTVTNTPGPSPTITPFGFTGGDPNVLGGDEAPEIVLLADGEEFVPQGGEFCTHPSDDAFCVDFETELDNIVPARISTGSNISVQINANARPANLIAQIVDVTQTENFFEEQESNRRLVVFDVTVPAGRYLLIVEAQWSNVRVFYQFPLIVTP